MPESLPLPFSGESLYSIGCRAHALSGNGHPAETSIKLFGNPHGLFRHDIPFNIREFANRTEGRLGGQAELIGARTLIPFFTRFMGRDRRARAQSLALSSVGPKLKIVLGLPASRTGSFIPLAACRTCAAEDRATHGVPFWRLAHQLPGALVCEKHEEPLCQASSLVSARHLRVCSLPFDGQIPLTQALDSLSMRRLDRLVSLARITSAIRESPLPAEYDAAAIRQTYLQGARDHGWLTRMGKVRVAEVLKALQAHFESVRDLEPYRGYFLKPSTMQGFLRLLRATSAEQSPLAHALMIDLLWGEWSGFCRAYEWQSVLSLQQSRSEDRATEIGEPKHRVLGPGRLARRAANRAKVEALIASEPGLTRPRAMGLLGWDIRWLAIWDKNWLAARLPPTPREMYRPRRETTERVDWQSRDLDLLRTVEGLTHNLAFASAEYVTRQTIVDRLGGLPFKPRWDKMPLSARALDRVAAMLQARKPRRS